MVKKKKKKAALQARVTIIISVLDNAFKYILLNTTPSIGKACLLLFVCLKVFKLSVEIVAQQQQKGEILQNVLT